VFARCERSLREAGVAPAPGTRELFDRLSVVPASGVASLTRA
jgi:hypothetical protein